MTSIALGVFIVFIIYVMIWSIRNDGARSIREQTGFIRMRMPPAGKVGHPKGAGAVRTPAQEPAGAGGADTGPADTGGGATRAPRRPAPGKPRPFNR